ncbi:MAG: type II secretion system F family protein [Vallitalea sp.]|jgi:type IV pilus assembly protein PilC|nr:type II secretion system F family protein [Vallitalea sp.]
MPEFTYIALNNQGKRIKGKIESKDKKGVFILLKENGFYPMEVVKLGVLQKDISFNFTNKVSSKDLAIFCRQFSNIINAGVTALEALNILKQQTSNKKLCDITNQMYESVKGGEPISESMKLHGNTFPSILINMVKAGEISGRLDIAFDKMAKHFEKENKLKQNIKKAITYPAIVSVIAIIVITILLTYVVPKFVDMLTDIGGELPATTKILIIISTFLKKYWCAVILVILGMFLLFRYYSRCEKGKLLFSNIKLKLPIFGKLNKKVISARFTSTLSTLLGSGIPLIKALEIVAKIVDNYVVEKALLNATEEVSRGIELSTPLRNLNIFPPMVIHMIKIGEETGTLESIMEKVADYYDDEVDTAVTQLTTMIEPIIIVILAIIVGFIVLSIIQPMFSIYGSISK